MLFTYYEHVHYVQCINVTYKKKNILKYMHISLILNTNSILFICPPPTSCVLHCVATRSVSPDLTRLCGGAGHSYNTES